MARGESPKRLLLAFWRQNLGKWQEPTGGTLSLYDSMLSGQDTQR